MNPPESIFRAGMKTFCRLFFGTLAICLAFLLFSIGYGAFSSSPMIEEKTTVTILPDAKDKREHVSDASPVILQIPIHGLVGDPKKLDSTLISDILLDSRSGLFTGDRVKGILLAINTPGGSAIESDAIYRLLMDYKALYKVPIVAYVEGLCASGGMFIASSADEIFACPSSVIGSVGVVMGPLFNVYDLMQKIGVQARTLTQGLDKDEFNPTRPWTPDEGAAVQKITAFLYHRFVDVVVAARPNLDGNKLVNEYGAKIFDCVEAQKLGYIDHAMSSRREALIALLHRSGIDAEKPYQVVSLSPKHPLLTELMSAKSPLLSGKVEHEFIPFEVRLREQPCYLYTHE